MPTKKLLVILDKFQVPFRCSECNGIYFPYRALNGIAFLWPKPIKETTLGGIHIPETLRDTFKTCYGVVLSTGKGCANKKTKEYIESLLTPGDVVIYDKNTPWVMEVQAQDGTIYKTALMNILDVNAIVEDWEEEK